MSGLPVFCTMARRFTIIIATALLTIDRVRAAGSSASPIANTDCGKVRGRFEGNLTVFQGIPYAAPPVGALRWQPPMRTTWGNKTVVDATKYGTGCVQYGGPQPNTGSEDWYAGVACVHVM